MSKMIKVGMADLKVAKFPDNLTTLGLGSCVGVCMYDPMQKIIGMAHIMLPSSTAVRNNTNRAKFADTAIDDLIKEMELLGAKRRNLVCKMAGGAQMFKFSSANETLKIGQRNAIAVKNKVNDLQIKIKADDTGGNFGRTIELYSESGKLIVKTIGHGVKEF